MKAGRAVRLTALAVTAVTCAVLARRLDHHQVALAFAAVNWGWVAVAALINVANTLVESVRWSLLASSLTNPIDAGVAGRPRGGVRLRDLPIGSAFLASVSGVAGGLMLPFKLGDGVKAYVFARANRLTLTQSVGTVVADRMTDLTAFAAMALVVSFTLVLPGQVGRAVHLVSIGLAAALLVLVSLAAARPLRRWLLAAGRPRVAALAGRALEALAGFGRAMPLRHVSVVAVLSWLLRGAVVWAMMRAFHLPLGPSAAMIALIIINVGIAVTGVPGNVGSFELATVGALELYSVAPEIGVSYAIALHATELLPVLAIGAFLALFGAIDLSNWSTDPAGVPPQRQEG